MRIFVCHPSTLLTDHRDHGDGLLAHRTIVELALRGHEIDVATPAVDCLAPLPSNVRVHVIPSRSRHEWADRIAYAVRVRFLFERLQARRRFDLVHQLNPVATGVSLALAGCGVPLVLGPFVGFWPGANRSVRRVALAALSWMQQRVADAFILSTEAAASRIEARKHARRRTFVIPYGIDLEAFPAQPPKRDGRTVVFLAATIWRKGIFTLLDAAVLLRRTIPDLEVIVAGDGWDADVVRAHIQRDGLEPHVTLLGLVPRIDVPSLLARANVFCLPSYGEPYGMAAIEAMASARAVVATNLGGLASLVDESGGRLVPFDDAPALAAALHEVLMDRELAERMGSYNRRRVETSYAWPDVIDSLESVYSTVLEARCSRS
ncbi:MAG: hypothetical protein PVSMB8_10520 [Vulcanimicrobiaceae bacterium]